MNVLSVYSDVYIAVCEFRDILLGGFRWIVLRFLDR